MVEFAAWGFAALNLFAFLLMGFDKLAARRQVWRVREQTLLQVSAIGGFCGIMAGSRVFRHKTIKQPFRNWLYGTGLLNLVWLWFLFR